MFGEEAKVGCMFVLSNLGELLRFFLVIRNPSEALRDQRIRCCLILKMAIGTEMSPGFHLKCHLKGLGNDQLGHSVDSRSRCIRRACCDPLVMSARGMGRVM